MKIKNIGIIVCSALLMFACSKESMIDEQWTDRLSEDITTKDFLLGETIYELPCSIKNFMDAGWEISLEGYDETLENMILPVQSKLALEASHPDFPDSHLNLGMYNESEAEASLLGEEVFVYEARIDFDVDGVRIPVMVKGGITEKTSASDAEARVIELNKKLYPNKGEDEELSNDEIVNEEDHYATLLDLTYRDGQIGVFEIGYKPGASDFSDYETKTQRDYNISKRKREIVEKSRSISSYGKLVETLKKGVLPGANVHELFAVIDEASYSYGTSEFSALPGNSLYLVKDAQGNMYALEKNHDQANYMEMPVLESGQGIEVWADANELIRFGEEVIPIIDPIIIERDGNMIYRSAR